MKRTIFFDMDGTIADLYGIENWLPKLRSGDTSPYEEAAVMLNMSLLARYLNQLQRAGYHIGIISWTSRGGSPNYNSAVAAAKRNWLQEHLKSVNFDTIHIIDYGVPKQTLMETDNDILFDDNDAIREAWSGNAYTPDMIITILKQLLSEG